MTQDLLRSRRTGKRLSHAIVGVTVVAAALAWMLIWNGGASNDTEQVDAANPTESDIELSGIVRDTGDRPIVAAQVCAYGTTSMTQLDSECTLVDANGEYRFRLKTGRYLVTASAAEYGSRSADVSLEIHRSVRLDLTLEPQAPTLAGIIRSAMGDRLADARVTVLQDELVIANVATNERGEFAASVPPGSFILKAEAAGFAAAAVTAVAPTMDVLITLFPGNRVAGKVLLESELRPVAAVRVVATSRTDRVVTRFRDAAVITDAHGNFVFADLPAGRWQLSVAGPNAFGVLEQPIDVTLDQDVRDITLLVKPARKVTGRFTLVDTGAPCASGQIQFIPQELAHRVANSVAPVHANVGTAVVTANVDATGAFAVEALANDTYALGLRCDNHELADGPKSLTVDDRPPEELLFKFRPGVGVIVRVIDEAQNPVSQAAVSLAAFDEAGMSEAEIVRAQRSGQTDASGAYRFGGLPVGRYRVTARYTAINGKASAQESVSLQADAQVPTLTLTLPGAGSIRIHAHGSSGAALSRVLFFALDDDQSRYEARYAGGGEFNIGPLPRGAYRVFGYDNKNSKMPLNGGKALAVSSAGIELDFNYDAPDGQLLGRVVDYRGAPMPGTLVRAVSTTLDEQDQLYSFVQQSLHGSQELMTDRDGRFRIEGLNTQGTYDLYLDHPDGQQHVRKAVVPEGSIEVVFPAPSRIEGSVVDTGGKPITEFNVQIVDRSGMQRSQSFARPDGHFVLANMFPGDLAIVIYDSSGDLSAERTGLISAGQSLDLGRITLTSGESGAMAEPQNK